MKKSIVFITICIAVILTFSNVSFAASKVVETPTIKTFVSGKQVKFNTVPISVKGEILISADELLAKLGVPNDSKHIIVGKNKKNLTIDNGKIKIKMTTNSNKATVDKTSKTLNSAPIIYKNKLYIPVKSSTQLLGMKFAWDNIEKSVYIQTVNDYNKVKAILDKAIKTTKKVDKYIVNYSNATSVNKFTSENKIDKNKMIDFSKCESSNINIDYYLVNNTLYRYYPLENREILPNEEEWVLKSFSKEQCQLWISQDDVSKFVISDILYCGLNIEDSEKDNTIKLKGNVYLNEGKAYLDMKGHKVEPIDAYSEIYINKSNYLITKINHTYSEYQKKASENKKLYTTTESYTYKDFNGDFSNDFSDKTLDEIKKALKETKIYLDEKDAEEANSLDINGVSDTEDIISFEKYMQKFNEQWIGFTELEDKYGISLSFSGNKIVLTTQDKDGKDIKYFIDNCPTESFEQGKIYKSSNGIKFQHIEVIEYKGGSASIFEIVFDRKTLEANLKAEGLIK